MLGLVRTAAAFSAGPDVRGTGARAVHEPEANAGLGFKDG